MSKSRGKQTATTPYKKRLEGINTNAELLNIWKATYETNVAGTKGANNQDDASSSQRAAPTNETDALEILRKAGDPRTMKKKKHKPIIMPIRVLQSIRILSSSSVESLDRALSSISLLAFSPPQPEPELTPHRQKYLARMEKLRLKSEETKYSKITTNIKDQRQEDDHTAKSMRYAASVGINMIVAPISFGAFMYFFSGGVFDYLFPPGEEDNFANKNPSGVDIKRLILGVVSGVAMMIIEMVLFVIRSHEFESHTTKKKKKKGVQPFGEYSANSAMTYKDDSGRIPMNTRSKETEEEPSTKKNK